MRSAPDPGAVPAGWAAPDNFFASDAWWRTMLAAGMPASAEARFLLCADAVLLPLQLLDGGRTLQSLTNPYTCLYQPLLVPGADAATLRRAGIEFGRFCRRWATVRLDALAEDFAELAPLLAGARRAGMLASRFAHFGNWHEPIAGRSWEQYLAARPGALRETVRRKLRRAQATLEIVATPADVEAGIDAYEDIRAQLEGGRALPALPRRNDAPRRRDRRAAPRPAARRGAGDRRADLDRAGRPRRGAEACP